MNSASLIFRVKGVEAQPPKGWQGIGTLSTFDGDDVQASITVENFEFILDAYQILKEHIADGLTGGPGIFEPAPLTIEAFSDLGNYSVFEGAVDLTKADINDEEGYIKAPLTKDMGLNTLDTRLSGLTYGLLEKNGIITSADYVDVPYVVDKPDRGLESAVLALTVYMMSKQLADTIKELARDGGLIASFVASIPGGPLGAVVLAAALVLINIAYAIAMLIIIIDLGKDIIDAFVQPVRIHKAMLLKTLMEKACEYLGYTFNTTVSDLDNVVYLPSNLHLDTQGLKGFLASPGTIEKGFPNPVDIGYAASEIFRIAKDTFHSRYMLLDGVVEFHAENSPFWKRLSTWPLREVQEYPMGSTRQEYRYNTDEMFDSHVISLRTDISDPWTIEYYKGTSYQVITSAITVGPSGRDHIAGLNEIALPVALGNRKDELNGFEKFLKTMASLIDSVTGVFGGGTNFAAQVTNKLGVLRVATNNHSVPKLLWMENGKIPSNHRDLFSAKTLWNKYHIYKSFVHDNFARQRKVYEGVEIPFGMADFLALIDNSYFVTSQGKEGKVTRLEWNMAKDQATIDYWIPEVYTKNLKEEFIEPE